MFVLQYISINDQNTFWEGDVFVHLAVTLPTAKVRSYVTHSNIFKVLQNIINECKLNTRKQEIPTLQCRLTGSMSVHAGFYSCAVLLLCLNKLKVKQCCKSFGTGAFVTSL